MEDYSLVLKALASGLALVILHIIYSDFKSPLRQIPGPFWARYTDLWRLLDVWRGTQITSKQMLHKKLGPVVRIGPTTVSLSDPSLLKTVYSTRGDFIKSKFYEVADAISEGNRLENIVSARDPVFYNKFKRPYQKYFSTQSIREKEFLADRTILSLCEQLEKRFMDGVNAGKTVPLGNWMAYGAWDLDWEMTFGEPLGFLEKGEDIENLMLNSEMSMQYLICIGQMPWLDLLLGKNPYCPLKFATFESAALYSLNRIQERKNSNDIRAHKDFMDNFMEAKEQYPDLLGDAELVSYVMMNVLAGADTVGITLKAIFYQVLLHPNVLKNLQEELDAANLEFPPAYEQTQDLPYLEAVIREGMRMHPIIGWMPERLVPAGGLTLPDGQVLPPGTTVGLNPWITSRNTEVYGHDADIYRPERWLRSPGESTEAYTCRLTTMKDSDMSFGAGKRACVGRNMAYMELHKVATTLFSRYDMCLDATAGEPTVRYWWLTLIDNLQVKMQRRPCTVKKEVS